MGCHGRSLILLLGLLGAGPLGCGADDDEPGDAQAAALSGHWVWYQQVEEGDVTLTITDEDLSVGDWPGCPSGIICTHYGIRKLRFGPGQELFAIHNVDTSSDYEYGGTFAVSGDLVSYQFVEHFSCAHPDVNDTETRTGHFRYRLEEGNLWVSVSGFGGHLPFFDEPPESPTRWIVFRPISETDYENRYMIRVCVETATADCHPGCFPEKYGTWGR